MRISRPKTKTINPEYINECAEMLAPAFNDLADLAEQRGWNCAVVAVTLLSLAKSNVNHRSAGAEFSSVIEAARIASME